MQLAHASSVRWILRADHFISHHGVFTCVRQATGQPYHLYNTRSQSDPFQRNSAATIATPRCCRTIYTYSPAASCSILHLLAAKLLAQTTEECCRCSAIFERGGAAPRRQHWHHVSGGQQRQQQRPRRVHPVRGSRQMREEHAGQAPRGASDGMRGARKCGTSCKQWRPLRPVRVQLLLASTLWSS